MIAIPFMLSAALAAGGTESSSLVLENCELGEMYAFNSAECEFGLTNKSDKPIHVLDVRSAVAEDSVDRAEFVLAPRSKAYVRATVNSGNAIGNFHRSFEFRTDETGYERQFANAYGFALNALDQVNPQIDFGVVSVGDTWPKRSIALSSQEAGNFKIKKVISKPAYLDVNIGADGHTLEARIKPDIQWGLTSDFIKLDIDTPRQKQAWVRVKSDVHGAIVPASNPLDMGLMRFTNHNEFKVQLTSRNGKNFKIGKIELENVQGKTQLSSCSADRHGCQLLTLTISDQQPAGAILGHVWIDFPDYHQRMNLAVWGLIVDKDMEVKTIDLGKPGDGATAKDESSKAASTNSIDLGNALKGAVSASDPIAPAGVGPLLKWTIANGMAIRGFQIFRGNSDAGPFDLLNPSTIRSTAQTRDPVNYKWRDNTAEAGKTYWYYIAVVYNDGHKQQLTGPQKVVAK